MACSADDVVTPTVTSAGQSAADLSQSAAAPASIDGSWDFSRLQQVTAPPWVAELIFGIEPEGPVTHFRCETSGTMELTQSNGTFSGTAQFTASMCETNGGQVFGGGSPESRFSMARSAAGASASNGSRMECSSASTTA